MTRSGKVFKYGDNVDTDVIIPARYLNTSDAQELAAHCMEDIDPSFGYFFFYNVYNSGYRFLLWTGFWKLYVEAVRS